MERETLLASYPVRLPVWWARRGPVGPHPTLPQVSGRFIVIRHRKRFNALERFIARFVKGREELRRPLDDMNSLLWELCDGKRTLEENVVQMESTFDERIAPATDRCIASLTRMEKLGLIGLLREPFDDRWDTGPGVDPSGELGPPDPALELDTSRLSEA